MNESALDTMASAMFNGYKESAKGLTYDSKPIPEWAELPESTRNHWRSAAKAAVNYMKGVTDSVIEELLTATYGGD